MSDISDLNEHEKDTVVDLAIHPAMWGWLIDAIREKGFDVSPPIPTSHDENDEPQGYFRCIVIPPERMQWAEEQLGRAAP